MKTIVFISKAYLYHSIIDLKKYVDNDAKAHFTTIGVEKYNLSELLDKAIEHIKCITTATIAYEYTLTPENLLAEIKTYISNTPTPKTDKEKSDCGRLVKKITQLVHYLISIPKGTKIRSISEQTISKELNKAISEKERIVQLKEHEEKDKANPILIQELENILREKELLIEKLKKERQESRNDQNIEEEWEKRIKESFNYLEAQTKNIEKRKNLLNIEYYIFLSIFPILTVFLIIWFCKLYCHLIGVGEITIQTYSHLLPFYIPIPIIAALFWVSIVQKNRCCKLIIALEEELFHIKYQQGLLMAINKLSINPEEAVSRINHTLDTMMSTYLNHTKHTNTLVERLNIIDPKTEEINGSLHIINNIIENLKK